jgi:hypothetical protein
LLVDKEGLILGDVQVVHKHCECKMPRGANLSIRYSICWVPIDLMSNLLYDLYCYQSYKVEIQSKSLLYEFVHIRKKDGMSVTMTSFSRPGFIELKVQ